MIAGLEETSGGQIMIGDNDVTSTDPAERGVAMVFQTYALYPHMSVRDNMGFGLKMNGVEKSEIARKVGEASRILKLDDYLDRKPKALSGGQRQRVAIGRAIVRGPEVFLFDEPLSNLDAELRLEMRVELSRLHEEIGATMIYVTHDQVEAMTLADKIVVLRAGRIEQVGAPLELYDNPDNKFVAGFLGSPAMNFAEGEVVRGGIKAPALSSKAIKVTAKLPAAGTKVWVGLRPEQITVEGGKLGQIELTEELGGVSHVHVRCGSEKVVATVPGKAPMKTGSQVGFGFDPAKVLVFDMETEARIR